MLLRYLILFLPVPALLASFLYLASEHPMPTPYPTSAWRREGHWTSQGPKAGQSSDLTVPCTFPAAHLCGLVSFGPEPCLPVTAEGLRLKRPSASRTTEDQQMPV